MTITFSNDEIINFLLLYGTTLNNTSAELIGVISINK